MAILFPDRAITATSNVKELYQKTIQLTFADVTTGGANSVKAVIPADSSIVSILYWKRTQFSGGGITAATLSIGIPGTPTSFVNAADVLTPAVGTIAEFTPITNIYQNYQAPLGSDISLLFTGTATTGNPSAGELMITVRYVR
jgi:hypothetical protein